MGLGEVERLRNDYDLQLDWKPFFLRPATPPEGLPLPQYIRERPKHPDNPLHARAKALGLTMIERDVLPSTRRAHEAAEFARDRGLLEPMHAALLRRYWTAGEDVYDLRVLRAAATEVGLDADELVRAIEGQSYTQVVLRSIAEAGELGVHALPLFVVRDELAIEGAQEARVFREAFARLGIAPKPAPMYPPAARIA